MSYPGTSTVINYPVVPFGIPIGGIITEKLIFIDGFVPHGADVFTINLQSTASLNDSPRPETPLHISVRLNTGVVIRNSFVNGRWYSEQRHGFMPFRHGASFAIVIKLDYDAYKIAVNGSHFAAYPYRTAKEVGSFLRVDGRVQITSVRFQGGSGPPAAPSYPSPPSFPSAPSYPGPSAYPGPSEYPSPSSIPPFYNPSVPFNTNIGPLSTGRMVLISGVPHPNAKHFKINLQCGLHPDSNVALHFDVRFNQAGDTNRVVRNHREYGTWGTEDRSGSFPFARNRPFDIIIMAESNGFKVAVDNRHFTEFPHRVRPLSIIDSLTVSEDVRLTLVRLQ